MWTSTTREHYRRRAALYQSDVTDAEWRLIAPHLPRSKRRGRLWRRHMREVVNAIFYVLRSGCPWRQMPIDLVPWSVAYRWFAAWRDGCVFERINHALVLTDRQRAGRAASASAAVLDSQSVKTTEAGGPRGYDAGNRIKGRKRHTLVDTDGRALLVEPHPADVQDRDGGAARLAVSRTIFAFVQRVSPTAPMTATGSPTPAPPRWRSSARSRSGWLRRPVPTLGRRALLRLDRAQPTLGEGLRGKPRLSRRLPLRPIRHAARPPSRLASMTHRP